MRAAGEELRAGLDAAAGSNVPAEIARFAREASLEITTRELDDIEPSRLFLPPGQRVFVSHLPGQSWQETEHAAGLLRQAGFDPVPHVPVRLLASQGVLEGVLANLVRQAQIKDLLLIAGDYAATSGPYSCVADVLRSGLLGEHGIRKVSIGGHPEGHPSVAVEEIRRAEREKAAIASELGLDLTFVTQFFFEADPFLGWLRQLRASGVRSRVVAGLAGPARIATLIKYAMRCGAGPSFRALGAHSTSLVKLMGNQGPENLMCTLAGARMPGVESFERFHFFSFGGYLRTCKWLHGISTELAKG